MNFCNFTRMPYYSPTSDGVKIRRDRPDQLFMILSQAEDSDLATFLDPILALNLHHIG